MAKPQPCPKPPTLRLARGLTREASDDLPIFCLSRGLARKASAGEPILRLARGPARSGGPVEGRLVFVIVTPSVVSTIGGVELTSLASMELPRLRREPTQFEDGAPRPPTYIY